MHLALKFGYSKLQDVFGWNGDPKKIRYPDQRNAFAAHLPFEIGFEAPQSPYPVAFLSGPMSGESWFQQLSLILEQAGIMTHRIDYIDDSLFAQHTTFFEAYMLLSVWGADFVLALPNGGKYSQMEQEFARDMGIDVLSVTPSADINALIPTLACTYFPNSFIPRGAAGFQNRQDQVKMILMNAHLPASSGYPIMHYRHCLDIQARRRFRMPWDETDPTQIEEIE